MRAVLFALMLGACAAGATAQPSPSADHIRADLARLDNELHAPGVIAAGIGETADFGMGLRIRPIEVIEDSRCAANVTCVWAGRLRLRVELAGAIHEMTLGESLITPYGAVALAVTSPGAWQDWPEAEIARPPYRFGFRLGER